MNERIFVDASFWIALRDPRDERSEVARKIAAMLPRARAKLYTTWFVAAEAHASVCRSRNLAMQILRDFEKNPFLTLETVTESDRETAIALLREQKDKAYSMCDAISFAVMERMGISRVLSFDDHFAQVGRFRVIDHPENF